MTLVFIRAVIWFSRILTLAMLFRAMLSWVAFGGGNNFVRQAYYLSVKLTEPIVAPCRTVLNRYFNTGAFDFSIVLAMLLLQAATRIIVRILLNFV